jgi:hypothetical protein
VTRRRIDGPDQEFLSVSQTAEWLGVPELTLKNWAEDRLIPQPRWVNAKVRLYHWRVVIAVGELLACGFLSIELPEEPSRGEPPPEEPRPRPKK